MFRNPTLFFLSVLIWTLTSCSKKDNDFPVITLNGDAVFEIILNSPFNDPGAEAYDETEGVISVEISGEVDTDFAGTYIIYYSASDASENTTVAFRTVIVRNQAGIYEGAYQAKTIINIDTTDFSADLVVSNTLNYRIWLSGFAAYQNASVYADIRQDSVFVPAQITLAGTPMVFHKFEGNGLIKNIDGNNVFEINFTDSDSGNIISGNTVYTNVN